MPFTNLIGDIVNKGLCTACGACQVACTKNYIVFDGIKVNSVLPETELNCGSCTDCLKTCPGQDPETSITELALFGHTRSEEDRWLGVYKKLLGGKSLDVTIFNKSASGGCTTTILKAAKESLGLDLLLGMGRNEMYPWKAAPKLLESTEELIACCQSTYQLVPYLNILRTAYVNHPHKTIGVAGVACHVQGIRKLQRLDSKIGEWARTNIKFIIEIACSSNTKVEGTESLITDLLKLELSDVKELRFREGEYPGQIMVVTKDNKKHYLPFWKAVRHFKENKTHRCLSCGDWLSGLADISISDGDPNIFNGSLGLNKIEKHGRIFIRTETGSDVVKYAEKNGLLQVWDIAFEGENLGLERKRNRRAAYERKDMPIPEGPIPGYMDTTEIIDDDRFLAVPVIKQPLTSSVDIYSGIDVIKD